jgi:peroxiredoxin
MQESNKKYPQFMATQMINAYYMPNPDWKQPDNWRDSIIAAHYFDYFNPADSFYLHTNILPEKMDIYLQLVTNKRDAYGQPVHNEMDEAKAAGVFLDKTGDASTPQYDYCLRDFLKRFDKQHKEQAFLYLYDNYLKTSKSDCGEENNNWKWARTKAELYKGLQIDTQAPDFVLDVNTGLHVYAIQSPEILLLFYASWCPHCGEEIPKIKQITDSLLGKELTIVAISLDTSKTAWNNFVNKNQLLSWLHYSEWKSWKSAVVKQYNVYATPTMFLLNEDKKIIAKPISAAELLKELKVNK